MREPTFTQPQISIAIAFACIAILVAAFFVLVAVRTRREVPFEEVRTVGYRIRPWWLAFLARAAHQWGGCVVVLVALLAGSRSR